MKSVTWQPVSCGSDHHRSIIFFVIYSHCMHVHKTKVTRPRPRRYIFKTETRPRRSRPRLHPWYLLRVRWDLDPWPWTKWWVTHCIVLCNQQLHVHSDTERVHAVQLLRVRRFRDQQFIACERQRATFSNVTSTVNVTVNTVVDIS